MGCDWTDWMYQFCLMIVGFILKRCSSETDWAILLWYKLSLWYELSTVKAIQKATKYPISKDKLSLEAIGASRTYWLHSDEVRELLRFQRSLNPWSTSTAGRSHCQWDEWANEDGKQHGSILSLVFCVFCLFFCLLVLVVVVVVELMNSGGTDGRDGKDFGWEFPTRSWVYI